VILFTFDCRLTTVNLPKQNMNYYKLTFNKEETDAYRMFYVAVTTHYGVDLWGPCDTSFILFATPDQPAEVMRKVDVSTHPHTSGFAGANSLNLQLGAAREDDPTLPDDARQWLLEQIKTRASIDELTKVPQGNGNRPLT